jgi:hypothetical protein
VVEQVKVVVLLGTHHPNACHSLLDMLVGKYCNRDLAEEGERRTVGRLNSDSDLGG